MKTLLTLFVLLFSSLVVAADISDFEIENMSIGDSLLDYISEEEILKEIESTSEHYKYLNNTTKFGEIYIFNDENFKTYENLSFFVKTDDKKYKIYSVDGIIYYLNNIDDCYKKKDEIEKELSEIFKDTKKVDKGTTKHTIDKSGKSTTTTIYWKFDSGDFVGLECYDWSKELETTKNWYDHLRISVVKKELNDWLEH